MRKNIVYLTVLALLVSLPSFPVFAKGQTPLAASGTDAPLAIPSGFKGDELTKNAKISLSDARAIALKASPGEITDEELEVEKGGSGLRYSFDIRQGSVVREVGVDAKTGKILENSAEGSNPD